MSIPFQFTCDLCALSFRQKQLLKRHKNLYHNPSYVAPTPKEKTHECAQCAKAFRHKGNLMRHMQLHDPDSKNALLLKQEGSFDHSQLIDDEYYEDEDDGDMETDAEGGEMKGNQVSIVTTDGSQLIEADGADGGTIAITIDSQTQQLINSAGGSEQVMFVVQYPDGTDGTGQLQITNGGAGGQQTATVVAVSATPTVSTPRIISRGGRVTRSAAKTTPSSSAGKFWVWF